MASVTFKNNPITLVGQELKVGDKAPDFTVLANDFYHRLLQTTPKVLSALSAWFHPWIQVYVMHRHVNSMRRSGKIG